LNHWTKKASTRLFLLGLAGDFLNHVTFFAHHFVTQTRDCGEAATQYMSGLMQAERKNMERMAEVVPDADDQALQHFLTNSPWDERAVMDQVAREANTILGGREDSCLLIDESGFTKKGTESVGVARQWLGREGKVDNGQVGVFAALAAGDRVTPVVLNGPEKLHRELHRELVRLNLSAELCRELKAGWTGQDVGGADKRISSRQSSRGR